MPTATPSPRLQRVPQTLIVGTGPYARSLAQILDARPFELEMLDIEQPALDRLLNSATRILLVIGGSCSAPNAISQYDQIYTCIRKRSKQRHFHQISVIFICPEHTPLEFETGIADGIGLDNIDTTKGVNVWRRSESLGLLLQRLQSTGAADWSELENRRRSRPKALSLVALISVILSGPLSKISSAAQAVWTEFAEDSHVLENYCNPPHHRNARKWREWLQNAVTGEVTPDLWAEGKKLLPTLKLKRP